MYFNVIGFHADGNLMGDQEVDEECGWVEALCACQRINPQLAWHELFIAA